MSLPRASAISTLACGAGEVDARRDERQPALLRARRDAVDLAAVQQQLARTLGLVVLARGGGVGRDVDRVQPQLAVADGRVAVLELRARGAQRLDLGPLEHDAALEPLEQLVAVRGVAVRRDVTRTQLALALALCHPPSLVPTRDFAAERDAGLTPGSRSTRPRTASTRATRTSDRVPEAIVTGALAAEDRSLLVELPPLAPAAGDPGGEEPHGPAAPRSRRRAKATNAPARRSEPDDLALATSAPCRR